MFYGLSAPCANVSSLIAFMEYLPYLTNDVQLKLFLENYIHACSPDVQGSFRWPKCSCGEGWRKNSANRWLTNRPCRPGRRHCSYPPDWKSSSAEAWPFPVWLCGISTRSHVECVHSCSVLVAAWTLRCPLTKLSRLSRWGEGTFCTFTLTALIGTSSSSLHALAGSHSVRLALRLKTKPCPHSHRVAQKLGRETRCVALLQQHRNRPSWSRFCLQDWFPPLNRPFLPPPFFCKYAGFVCYCELI